MDPRSDGGHLPLTDSFKNLTDPPRQKIPMKTSCMTLAAAIIATFVAATYAEDKVALEQPKQEDFVTQLKDLPDGILRIKTNDDGSFRSLVVKATVEIEGSLSATK